VKHPETNETHAGAFLMKFMLSWKLKVSPASSRIRIFLRVSYNLAAIIAEKKVFEANVLKNFS